MSTREEEEAEARFEDWNERTQGGTLPCQHPDIIITPSNIKAVANGIVLSKLFEDSVVNCRSCHEDLPLEDAKLYSNEHIFVGVPKDLVDDD